tara:strand:+ start:17029 stop:17637 length:609 start_codon:yes stop_codon:yes gene_type:complete
MYTTFMNINRQIFFDSYRSAFGKIRSNNKVANINIMLDSLVRYSHLLNPATPIEQLAYIAATVHHETGARYSAFKEVRQRVAITKRQKYIRRLQDRYWYTGYYGRGPVQLTWKRNYQWAQRTTGAPLVANPNLLLEDPYLGYEVTIKGMVEGAYTGKSLSNYINKSKIDYVNARRIVNGKDKAAKIAQYAIKFETIFRRSVV